MANGRMYTVNFGPVSVTTAQDLFQIIAPSNAAVIVHNFELSQSSDSGDAESEQLALRLHRGTTTGTGGTAPTPSPAMTGFGAAGSTVTLNNTTQSTEGAIQWNNAFNVLAGYEKISTPETQYVISPSERLVLSLLDPPADSLTMFGSITFEEIGG